MPMLRKFNITGAVLLALALPAAALMPARAGYPVAPDVVVFCEPTLQHALTDLGGLWRSQTGIHVRVFTSPIWALLEQIARGVRDDVIIGEGDGEARAATERHLIKPDTLQKLWRNQLVVAELDGSSGNESSGSAPATGKLATVAGKATIAVVDPGAATAGADSKEALQSLGLWQAVKSRSVGVVATADASFLVEQGKAKLAVVYATDVAANGDFTVTEKLPEASYPPIVYWVALPARSLSPNASKFISFLHEDQVQRRLRADGLEVLP
jgi:molybdate transport system substrate-binding protein